VAHWSAAAPLAVVSVPVGSVIALALAYGLLGAGVVAARRKSLALPLLALTLIGCGTAWALSQRPPPGPPPAFEVTFLDVGQGDATLLRTPEGANVLVDCGPPEAQLAGRLRSLGVDGLDLLVTTHPQRDHDGGCPEVRKQIRVRRRVDRAVAGEQFALGALRLRVLSPAQPFDPDLGDPNLQAIVLHASYGPTDVLLPADAESEVIAALDLPRAELLKVAHHGSDDSGLPEMLTRVRPDIAAIEVGADNRYGHPTPQTLSALRAVPNVYRTDRDGDVRVRAMPRGFEVD
jgi:competence protein ComEC